MLWKAEAAAESSPADFAEATQLVNMARARASNQQLMGICRTFVLSSQTHLIVDNNFPAANYLVNQYPYT